MMEYFLTKCVLGVGKCQSKSIQKQEEDKEEKEIDNVEVRNIVPPLPAQKTGNNRVHNQVRFTVVFLQKFIYISG